MRIKALFMAAMAALGTAAIVPVASAGYISGGNLVVTQFGDGSGTLNGNAHPVIVREFTTAGGVVQSIPMPVAAGAGTVPNPMTASGSATSEGFIALSTDGNYLTLTGYAATPGTVTPQSSAATVIARVVGRITVATGDVDTTTALTNGNTTSNIRSAVSTNGIDIWTGGSGTSGVGLAPGVSYTTLGATTATRVNDGTGGGSNRRVVGIYNGQLYVTGSTTGGPNFAVNAVGTGLPTTGSTGETTLSGMPIAATHSPYDFWFRDDNTLYVADDGTAANGGGIQKWTQSAGTWSLQYTMLNDGATASTVRGLTGYVDGSNNAVLFGVTGASLLTVTDAGVDNDTGTVLATAAAGTAFRGVEYIPIPEPTSMGLLALGGLALIRRKRA